MALLVSLDLIPMHKGSRLCRNAITSCCVMQV